MSPFRKTSIKWKITFVMMLASSVVAAIAWAAFLYYDIDSLKSAEKRDLRRTAEIVAGRAAPALALEEEDLYSVKEALSLLDAQPGVVAAFVFKPGTPKPFALWFASWLPENENLPTPLGDRRDQGVYEQGKLLVVNRDLRSATGTLLGTLQIHRMLSEYNEHIKRSITIAVGILLASLLIAFFLAAALQRVISAPILELADIENRVSRTKDFSLRATQKSGDEIGLLINGFNEMLDHIEAGDAELRVAKERAEKANEVKSNFVANMSHELRNPLNVVIGFTDALAEERADDNDLVDVLQNIRRSGKQLLLLVNDILDLAKMDADKMQVFITLVDVTSLLAELQASLAPDLARQKNTLTVTISDEARIVKADRTKLERMLLNLLSNANKFTEHGQIRVDVGPSDDQSWIHFRVTDTGIGITPEQIERLFQPFSQADASTTRKFGGTGLGLHISRRYSQLMRGDIRVASEPGGGSVFTIILPRNLEVDSIAAPQIAAAPVAVRFGKRVLLTVDDDPSVRELVKRVAERESFEVVGVSTGEEALQTARELRPDLIVLDVILPGMSGWTVLTTLKADAELASIPVVMLTMVDDKKRGFALGASDFVLKPVEGERLVKVLRRLKHVPATLLLVEDDRGTRDLVRTMLERESWTVAEAAHGGEALEWLRSHRPSVVLLDLMMPGMDGFTFIEELRARAEMDDVPVVVLTAKELTSDDRLRLKGGVDRILQKGSYSRDELESTLRGLLVRYTAGPSAKMEGHA